MDSGGGKRNRTTRESDRGRGLLFLSAGARLLERIGRAQSTRKKIVMTIRAEDGPEGETKLQGIRTFAISRTCLGFVVCFHLHRIACECHRVLE
jgi:hypothetical protein